MAFKSISIATTILVLSTSVNAAIIQQSASFYADHTPRDNQNSYHYIVSGDSLDFEMFNSQLGTLNSISISIAGDAEPTLIFSDYVPGTISHSLTFSSSEINTLSGSYQHLATYDQCIYGGCSSWSWGPRLSYSLFDTSSDSNILDRYTNNSLTTDYFTLIINTSFNVSDFQGRTYVVDAGSTVGGVTLTYDYTPTVVPVPAAVWLFGSGLIGLIGMARRKKA